MKKLLVIALSMVMVLSLLTGCSSNSDSSESESSDAGSLEGKTVTVGRWGGNDAETAAFNQMLEDFTAATGILVEERIYSDYNTELQAELIGGTAPDVFYVDGYMAPFYSSQGVLMALDAEEFELDKFYQPLRDTFLFDGEYYAVSKDCSTLALYYNKAYVSAEDIPATMEELFGGSFLTDLQATLPEGMVAMTYNQDLARQLYLAESGGLDITKDDIYSNIASEGIADNLRFIYDAAIEGKIKTPGDLGMGWNGDAFGNEKTAIMIEGNWTLGHLQTNFPDVEFGVIEVPTFNGEKGTMVFNVGYGISAASKNVEVAKAFIKYATGSEGMATWTLGAGVLPAREDVADATDVASDEYKVAHLAGNEYATPWQKGTTMDTINNEYRNYIPSVVNGERTLEEALQLAEDEANKTIEANQ